MMSLSLQFYRRELNGCVLPIQLFLAGEVRTQNPQRYISLKMIDNWKILLLNIYVGSHSVLNSHPVCILDITNSNHVTLCRAASFVHLLFLNH